MTRTLVASSLLLSLSLASAQDRLIKDFTKEINPTSSQGQSDINASHYRVIEIDLSQLYAELENVPHREGFKTGIPTQIELPQINGGMKRYQVMENSTLHPELAAKYPEIKTYDAYGIDNPGELVKFDITPKGFHAMIITPGEHPVFIDPLKKDNTPYYILYSQKDFSTTKRMRCGVISQNKPIQSLTSFQPFNPCELKKYRLAMAATAQYTAFQGGTVPQALAAEATTMNRVNGVYETEMAITMEIIANNQLIIYTNPNNQPYTSGDPDAMIGQNQTNIDHVIGTDNYDIGHVVDAAGSGLATLGSVCDPSAKARGVTGTDSPQGDPFDIGYVAHEMGHQFGANHVQNNNCQRNLPTAVEPGSGSTIMSYAGICEPNVQNDSDAYFNGINLQEMGTFVASEEHLCPVKTPIPSAPVILSTNGPAMIPANTPFALTATATPSDGGTTLTYGWEQMNHEATTQPPTDTATGGPNFRSFTPQTTATRFFPNLTALANNGPFTWEVIPSVTRKMTFRVSVRRNTPNGSCNAYTDTTLTTTTQAGPFLITYPTSVGIHLEGATFKTITWDVANTDSPPINAAHVDILLSTDGGLTYPYVLMTRIANNGTGSICVPNLNTSTARIMVKSEKGTFFNVSKNNFSITAAPPKAPELSAADRNGMETTEAFITYTGCIPITTNDTYTLNGLPNAHIRLDRENQRFVITNITTPRKVTVSITATDANQISRTSNPVTIPSILS